MTLCTWSHSSEVNFVHGVSEQWHLCRDPRPQMQHLEIQQHGFSSVKHQKAQDKWCVQLCGVRGTRTCCMLGCLHTNYTKNKNIFISPTTVEPKCYPSSSNSDHEREVSPPSGYLGQMHYYWCSAVCGQSCLTASPLKINHNQTWFTSLALNLLNKTNMYKTLSLKSPYQAFYLVYRYS